VNIDSILQPFQRFGVHLGLERIEQLLVRLGNPQAQVPIIHVAGTNGKGSVCAYLSSILTQAGYKVGRYTSPHLVDWNERICLNEQPISLEALQNLLLQVQNAINPATESPTQFEVITAAAWLYFAQSRVDIAIVEVGLGGRLDATNICDRPLVSVITSISREHWQQLGSTLAEIATEKAGIIKPSCPVVVGQLPPEAENVVRSRITKLNCPAVFVEPATELPTIDGQKWANYQNIAYPLPLLGKVQLNNSAIAIATIQVLQQKGWQIAPTAIADGMKKTRWLGRLQWIQSGDRLLLIDGAHNPAAAQALRQYTDTLAAPITWVMGMLATKDHAGIFTALLRPGDSLHLVPVPDHSSADPLDLAQLARNICPELETCDTYDDLNSGLEATKGDRTVILCGSLYLVGHFLKSLPSP
jgi:dihydrofolate synthase / folylpolyglutamate synthase